MQQPIQAIQTRLAYPFPEAARLLGISRTTFWKIRKLGLIPVCDDGVYRGVMHNDLVAYLESIKQREPQ